jgi:hypothetical protein
MIATLSSSRHMRLAMLFAPLAAAFSVFATQAPAAADGSDRVSFGSGVTVRPGEEITGDLVVFGGDADIYGKVDGDAVVMGGNLTIEPSGSVDGSTVAFGGSVTNNSEQPKSGHHKVKGVVPPVPPVPIVTPEPVEPLGPSTQAEVEQGRSTGWIGFLIVSGILSLLAFALVPNTVRTVRDEFVARPILGTAIGFCWPFIFTAIIIALAITIIGIVLMPAAVVAVAAAYLVGRAAVALLLGRRLFEVANVVEPAPLATAALGLVIITVLEGVLPLWMGIVLEACVGAVAIGAAMLPFLKPRQLVAASHATYIAPPQPVFTPPSPPPPSGPPAVPQ